MSEGPNHCEVIHRKSLNVHGCSRAAGKQAVLNVNSDISAGLLKVTCTMWDSPDVAAVLSPDYLSIFMALVGLGVDTPREVRSNPRLVRADCLSTVPFTVFADAGEIKIDSGNEY